MGVKNKDLDEILVESSLIGIDKLKNAWDIQRRTDKKIESILLELNYVTIKDILFARAKNMGVDFLDLTEYMVKDPHIPRLISENIARKYILIPVEKSDDVLTVAMSDPKDLFAIDDLTLATSLQIKPVFSQREEIEKLIERYFTGQIGIKLTEIVDNGALPNDEASDVTSNDEKIKNLKKYLSDNKQDVSPFKNKLGSILVNSGIINKEELETALKIQSKTREKLGEILIKEGAIEKKTLLDVLAIQLNIPYTELDYMDISSDVIKLVNKNFARRNLLIPIEKEGSLLKVAMSDPTNIFSQDDLRLSTGMEIMPYIADEDDIIKALDKYYGNDIKQTVVSANDAPLEPAAAIDEAVTDKEDVELDLKNIAVSFEEELKKVNEEIAVEIRDSMEDDSIDVSDVQNAPIVKMVNLILNKAATTRASDIHIEPYEDCVIIRNRIDGLLVQVMKHEKKILPALVARIKIISGLNIAEKRIPQDGRIAIKIGKQSYDLRVSILPTMFGEKVVIRLADKEGFNVGKKELGFFDDDMLKFDEILSNPHGIVLVTGPTGSGKSTTLYTALKELSKPSVNILTVEDPVECTIRGISQVQVNVKSGLTFATALRSFLRQDPDIIMVGEIRDSETAEIATRAAITGHLVLSTLHTNDAASSITRIINMGIEPFMISSSLVGVIAQRLVRRLCPKCKVEYKPSGSEKEMLQNALEDEISLYLPKGCPVCNNAGYKGRIAIYEIMSMNNEIRDMISKNVTADVLKATAIKNGMNTLRDSCTRLVVDGITSVEELIRVTYTKE